MDPADLTSGLDTSTMLISVVAGAFGTGYFVYGRKQQRIVALLAGVALCIYPWFVSSLGWSIAIGVVLLVLPFVVRR